MITTIVILSFIVTLEFCLLVALVIRAGGNMERAEIIIEKQDESIKTQNAIIKEQEKYINILETSLSFTQKNASKN